MRDLERSSANDESRSSTSQRQVRVHVRPATGNGNGGRSASIITEDTKAERAVAPPRANGARDRQRVTGLGRNAAAEELERANADLRNLFESTEIGIILLDRALRVRHFTPAVTALFDLFDADPGRPLTHFTHRLDYPGLAADVADVLRSLQRIEREVASDTGEWFVVRISPHGSRTGQIDGAVLTFVDNTARHRVEEELREAKAEAESANLAKRRLLETVSHELRCPLSAILGYVEILRDDGTLTAEQEQRVGWIEAAGRHLASMVDDILCFSRLDSCREVIEPATLDARSIAAEVHSLLGPLAAAKDLAFRLDVPAEGVALETDIRKARQILINLCGNAVKYTDDGEIRLGVRGDRERVVFEIRDTGIGIAAEHQARIFDRFWQVDGGATRLTGGLGIGLAVARQYGRLLGGDVEVESEPGKGSTFRVWLPGVPRQG